MGIYLNPNNVNFYNAVHDDIYVDKTSMIDFTNGCLNKSSRFMCVSRPRRFGKSIAAAMLAAYYSKGCDSRELFKGLDIERMPSFESELNKNNVIYIDISQFRSKANVTGELATLDLIQKAVIEELAAEFPNTVSDDDRDIPSVLEKINYKTGDTFIIIIDEWDCLFREDTSKDEQERYVMFLRGMFKSVSAERFVKLAYITGILPIKKYGTQSALNNFREYTMARPGRLAGFLGFTEQEVKGICEQHGMDFEEIKRWYDGYSLGKVTSIYTPNSVVNAVTEGMIGSYWTRTETYESLKMFIEMNFDGLRDAVIRMLGDQRVRINIEKFQNDMTTINSADDALTLLVHLGYLAFDAEESEVYIPNQEIAIEFANAVDDKGWGIVGEAIRQSNDLVKATIEGDSELVAERLEQIHEANTSVLAYNNENSLSCAVTIAYYSARKDYTMIRELPTGKGFADIVFIPHRNSSKPAMIVELKYNSSADGAISQIKEKRYSGALDEYSGDILLVGISYDKEQKKHECVIEHLSR